MDQIDATFTGGDRAGPFEVVDGERDEPRSPVEVGVDGAEVGGVLDHDPVVAFELGRDERERLLGSGRDEKL